MDFSIVSTAALSAVHWSSRVHGIDAVYAVLMIESAREDEACDGSIMILPHGFDGGCFRVTVW